MESYHSEEISSSALSRQMFSCLLSVVVTFITVMYCKVMETEFDLMVQIWLFHIWRAMFTETCTGFPIRDAFKLENHKGQSWMQIQSTA